MKVKTIIYFWFLLLSFTITKAQQNSYNFHHITVADGLHDGVGKCIAQDKYGYIWIGTVGGLNRFDGKKVKQFTYSFEDSLSTYASQPNCLFSDKAQRLWAGFQTGLMEFDFSINGFRKINALENIIVSKIESPNDSTLFLATSAGLVKYNTKSHQTFFYNTSKNSALKNLLSDRIYGILVKGNDMYLYNNLGILKFNYLKNTAEYLTIQGLPGKIRNLEIDYKNNFWVGTQSVGKIFKVSADLKLLKIYDKMLTTDERAQYTNVRGIFSDNKNRIWVTTNVDGLLKYDEANDTFIKYLHDENLPSSPASNNYRVIFQDREGLIWLGGDVDGVTFYNPESSIFQNIFPYKEQLNLRQRKVSRAFAQDKTGNYWMGTHDGVSMLNPKTGQYKYWHNEDAKANKIYHNAIRSMLCDTDNNIWIGTLAGVNRYNSQLHKMEFISFDKLPGHLYNAITMDKSGNVWFACDGADALYWYNIKNKTFHSIKEIKGFEKLSGKECSYFFEDSKHRLWVSITYTGLLMYDKTTGKSKFYEQSKPTNPGIMGNIIIEIKEDKKGVIWISTFSGINGIDVEKNKIYSFNNRNGLAGNMVSPIAIDSLDRIWFGATGGLMMLNRDRTEFTSFSEKDGLASVEFPEHASAQLADGQLVFPSNNGFIKFNPNRFIEGNYTFPFYVKTYAVFEKEIDAIENETIKLKAKENAFTLNIVALNYLRPSQTWYAYKLEGFENQWHYTKDPKAVFTNVPGGNYQFLYKAASINTNWDTIKAKTIEVQLATIFYKSNWFLTVVFLVLTALAYLFYKYRVNQQKQLYALKSQAQNLEKEKAKVMYESLKQQLNPHFLFNSLTSLSGLIQLDQAMAGDFLDQMSSIYRYILKNGNNEMVPLSDEIAFVKTYVTLQKTRFKKGLIVNINIPEEYLHYKIAPVTLQNLIENAIKHNVIDAEVPLVIDIFIEGDYIIVKNNLQKKNIVETSNKKGLDQFKNLYRYLSKNEVVIKETENEFIIKIPLI